MEWMAISQVVFSGLLTTHSKGMIEFNLSLYKRHTVRRVDPSKNDLEGSTNCAE
jgi:hypothetical protein